MTNNTEYYMGRALDMTVNMLSESMTHYRARLYADSLIPLILEAMTDKDDYLLASNLIHARAEDQVSSFWADTLHDLAINIQVQHFTRRRHQAA